MSRSIPSTRDAEAASVPIVLYTRPACHLCELMKSELERAGLLAHDVFREVDIDRHPALAERFGAVVPVLEIGGRIAFRARIRPGTLKRRFRRLSERYRRSGPAPGAIAYPLSTRDTEPPE